MSWIVAGMLGAIGIFTAFVWIHGLGYDEGFQDGKSFQARQQAYETPLPMPGMPEPLDELDEAKERNMAAMLQVAADAWQGTSNWRQDEQR